MARNRQPDAMRMGVKAGVQSRAQHAKFAHGRGGNCLQPRRRPCGGGGAATMYCSDLTTREDAGGWIRVTPEPRALQCPYSVLSFDRIGRWWRECKMLGLGQDVRARVSDPKKRVQTELVVPQHGPGKAMSPQMEIHRGNEHLGSSGEYPGVGEPGGYPRVVGRGNTPRPHYKPGPTPTPTIDPSHNSNPGGAGADENVWVCPPPLGGEQGRHGLHGDGDAGHSGGP